MKKPGAALSGAAGGRNSFMSEDQKFSALCSAHKLKLKICFTEAGLVTAESVSPGMDLDFSFHKV